MKIDSWRVAAFFLGSSLLLSPSGVRAQVLWNGTRYGMSVDQVKEAVPKAIRPEKPSRLGDGSEELLMLEPVTVVGRSFAARFYFRAQQLCQVTLSLTGSNTFHDVMLAFDSLSEVLRSKYGGEINRDVSMGALNQAEATWVSGRTNITLFAQSVGDKDAVLNVNYQVRVAAEADKL